MCARSVQALTFPVILCHYRLYIYVYMLSDSLSDIPVCCARCLLPAVSSCIGRVRSLCSHYALALAGLGAGLTCIARSRWALLPSKRLPTTGTPLNLEYVHTPGTPTVPPVLGSVDLHLALHGVHMDYIMRVHSTN